MPAAMVPAMPVATLRHLMAIWKPGLKRASALIPKIDIENAFYGILVNN